MFGDALSLQQCDQLIAQLADTVSPHICAHGRPTMHVLCRLPNSPATTPSSRNLAESSCGVLEYSYLFDYSAVEKMNVFADELKTSVHGISRKIRRRRERKGFF